MTQTWTIDERFDRLESQVAEIRSEIVQLYRWTIGSIFAALSLGIAASRVLG